MRINNTLETILRFSLRTALASLIFTLSLVSQAEELEKANLAERHAKFESLDPVGASSSSAVVVEEEVARRDFGLDKPAYDRYRELMRGVGRFGWGRTDPLFILGVYARDSQERAHYAQLLATYERNRVQALLDFNQAYVKAGHDSCPDCQMFDLSRTDYYAANQVAAPLQAAKEEPQAQPKKEDQVVFFTRLECDECDQRFQRALARTSGITTLQVYLKQATPPQIKAWAEKQHLTLDDIQQKRVALHAEQNERELFHAQDGEAFTVKDHSAYQLSLESPFKSNEPKWTPP